MATDNVEKDLSFTLNWKDGSPVDASLIEKITLANNVWLELISWESSALTVKLKTKHNLDLWEGTLLATTGNLDFTATVKENQETYEDTFSAATKVDISQRALEYKKSFSLLGSNDSKVAITAKFQELGEANITASKYPELTTTQLGVFQAAYTNQIPGIEALTLTLQATAKAGLQEKVNESNPSFDYAATGNLSAMLHLSDPGWLKISAGVSFQENWTPNSATTTSQSVVGQVNLNLLERVKFDIAVPIGNTYPAIGEPTSIIGGKPLLKVGISFDF